ncbi:DUF1330 domain-containing protein [Rhodanobacter sp. 115]|uniref:DUF1330 domain-containing protein n=1 Tax=Rhodanobacter sp. FW021-MT20 TaxID=1162282 RepID=UPI0005685F7F|nr:DUF1330 domain-containing protein [Rhodanobacter sp. 115]
MARGYWVVTFRSVSDESRVDAYADASLPAIQRHGGRVLAAGVPAFNHEAGSNQRVAMVEFDSVEAAEMAYLSHEYQASLQHLAGAAVRDVRIIEGR